MLSRNEFVHEPEKNSTLAFESMTLDIHINEISVPFNYETLYVYQRNDKQSEEHITS